MKESKDFSVHIEQVKEDLVKIKQEITVKEAVLIELRRHQISLEYFLDVIEE